MGEGVSNRPSPLAATGEYRGASAEALALVDDMVREAAHTLFGSYGVRLEGDSTPVTKTLGSVHLVSIIGFSSESFSGSLLLASPNSVVEHTLPAPDASLADWSGELCNQLLGRLKNRLLDYEVAVNISLPVVIAGGRFALPAKTRPLTRYFAFASEWGGLFVRLEAEIGAGFELVRQTDTRQGMIEGEQLMF